MNELIKTINNDKKSADLLFTNKFYTQATILYFKTLFAISDYIIQKETGEIIKNHTQRFQILKSKFNELYQINDKYFPIYQQTYSTEIEKNICEEIKKNVELLIKKYNL